MEGSDVFMVRITADEEVRLRVAHAVDPNIREASVGGICEKAGISRRSFYRLFPSKYDINPWYKDFFCRYTIDKIGAPYSCQEAFERYFCLMEKEHDCIMRNAAEHYLGDPSTLDSVAETLGWRERRKERIEENLRARGISPEEEGMQYSIDIYTVIVSYATRRWLLEGRSSEGPRDAACHLVACIPEPIRRAFEK